MALSQTSRIEIGVDVVPINRINHLTERWNEKFIVKTLTQDEIFQCRGRPERIASLIAAKEACSKVLGVGMRGVSWREIEILHLPNGKPTLHLHRRAKLLSENQGWHSWSISLTHDGGLAIAVVVALLKDHF
ncbi:MAG: holo-ACP synthase [bacterium]